MSHCKLATCFTENFKLIVIARNALFNSNASENIWQPGSAWTGSLHCSPDPLAWGGVTRTGRGGGEGMEKGEERTRGGMEGEEWEEKGRGGRVFASVKIKSWVRPWCLKVSCVCVCVCVYSCTWQYRSMASVIGRPWWVQEAYHRELIYTLKTSGGRCRTRVDCVNSKTNLDRSNTLVQRTIDFIHLANIDDESLLILTQRKHLC